MCFLVKKVTLFGNFHSPLSPYEILISIFFLKWVKNSHFTNFGKHNIFFLSEWKFLILLTSVSIIFFLVRQNFSYDWPPKITTVRKFHRETEVSENFRKASPFRLKNKNIQLFYNFKRWHLGCHIGVIRWHLDLKKWHLNIFLQISYFVYTRYLKSIIFFLVCENVLRRLTTGLFFDFFCFVLKRIFLLFGVCFYLWKTPPL